MSVRDTLSRHLPFGLGAFALLHALAVWGASPGTSLAANETGAFAATASQASERPPLPQHAQLTFAVNKGTSSFRIGETIHTLEIKDGRYILKAKTTTVGLAKLIKDYELDQYSNGTYDKHGLQPDTFTEERIDGSETQRNTAELNHETQQASFSSGAKMTFPPKTQDILSIMYQFPPLAHTEIASVSICSSKKIEHYDFAISADEEIDTPLGKLLAVRLRKLHRPNEEGLEIWLARKYGLLPVKMRFIEKNGDIVGEAVIIDIRVSEEPGVTKHAAN